MRSADVPSGRYAGSVRSSESARHGHETSPKSAIPRWNEAHGAMLAMKKTLCFLILVALAACGTSATTGGSTTSDGGTGSSGSQSGSPNHPSADAAPDASEAASQDGQGPDEASFADHTLGSASDGS